MTVLMEEPAILRVDQRSAVARDSNPDAVREKKRRCFLLNNKQNVSGYVCNHGSPSGERDTASPRGRYGERLQRDSCLKNTYVKTPSVGRRQPMTSLPVLP